MYPEIIQNKKELSSSRSDQWFAEIDGHVRIHSVIKDPTSHPSMIVVAEIILFCVRFAFDLTTGVFPLCA
jgi:hypothetical protein